ncbi:glucocorticoid modulatory element-binding protein 2 isoform X1 [Amblyraja radiata]|uniref:glucocorticoid modulatory element-binding protein 2 isoform X1 n=2 Tax=Amblyraja radiata TaxID=386614 RepID=UPI001402BCD5|nr:glucocorticoid modulatory element-binding protein 2 isoform X1 [Amblyraja radiata]
MATPDVSVHVEEVVVVTTPDTPSDGSAIEEVKTVLVDFKSTQPRSFPVMLQCFGGLSEDSMDSVNTPGTYSSSSTLIQKGDIIEVKISDEGDHMEPEIVYPITCGESKANLIWRKFVCPGINIKCVQFDNQLISPKEFVNLAGKSTLKDWKRAIRLNGVMLRKIMDSGEMDFFQHSKVCSNTCRSTKIDLSSARSSLSSQQSTEYIPVTPAIADMNGSPAASGFESCEDSCEWISAISDDTFTFWRGLKEAGLLEDVMQEFQQEMQGTLKGLQQRLHQPPLQVGDAIILNNIVQSFGLLDLVKKVLASHKSQMDRSREQYTRDLAAMSAFHSAVHIIIHLILHWGISLSMEWHGQLSVYSLHIYIYHALEQQCDEHRKRAKELKYKSQHLNNVLMTLTPIVAAPPSKRPRLTRATSGPATMAAHLVTSPSGQITLASGVPISQLANIGKLATLSTIPISGIGKLQPHTAFSATSSPLIGGYSLLASSPGIHNAVEIHPDASNLAVLSTAAIQDGNTVLKVVSPIQLFTTVPGLNATLHNANQMTSVGSTYLAVPSGTIETTSGEGHATIQVTSISEEHEQKP